MSNTVLIKKMQQENFCPLGVINIGKAIVNNKWRNVTDCHFPSTPPLDGNSAPRHISKSTKKRIADLWDDGNKSTDRDTAIQVARNADDFHFELGAQYLDKKIKEESANRYSWLD